MRVYRKITDLIGGTPLLELTNYEKANELNAKDVYKRQEHYYCFTPQYVAGEAALLFKAGFAEVRVCWAKSNTAVLLATK